MSSDSLIFDCDSEKTMSDVADPPLRLYGTVDRSETLGPGKRALIWFQGCPFSCPGCIAPDSQLQEGGHATHLSHVLERIDAAQPLDGVTISGGEPFAQPRALAGLAIQCRKRGLGVIVFSGYRLAALEKQGRSDPHIAEALAVIDVLIDGLFVASKAATTGMRGSSNQTIHFLTERYMDRRNEIEFYDRAHSELAVTDDGVMLIGVPSPGMARTWTSMGRSNREGQT